MASLFHATEELCWLNASVPTDSFDLKALSDLEAEYAARGREPFFEFAEEIAPGLSEALLSRGYKELLRTDVLVFDNSRTLPRSSAVTGTVEDLEAAYLVSCEAFGQQPKPWAEVKERQIASLQSGTVLVANSFEGGEVVSTGQAVGTTKVREVAGLATKEAFRKRGHCSAVVNRLLADFLAQGGEVAWTVPGHSDAHRLYNNLGFSKAGTSVAYVLS